MHQNWPFSKCNFNLTILSRIIDWKSIHPRICFLLLHPLRPVLPVRPTLGWQPKNSRLDWQPEHLRWIDKSILRWLIPVWLLWGRRSGPEPVGKKSLRFELYGIVIVIERFCTRKFCSKTIWNIIMIYLRSICAREQGVGCARISFATSSPDPEIFVCLFVCLFAFFVLFWIESWNC